MLSGRSYWKNSLLCRLHLPSVHDLDLASTLNSLSQQLIPDGVNIIQYDVNSLYNEIIANPGKYGFTNLTDSCLSSLKVPVMGPATPCADTLQAQNQYLFWDGEHPTTAVHQLIADGALAALDDPQPVPEPSNELGMLAIGALGGLALYRRREQNKNKIVP